MVEQLLINLERTLQTSPFLGLFSSFIAGIIVSFSPCIYPLIPITLSIVGVASTSSRKKGFLLSFIFVLGICFVYTILGFSAALLGFVFNLFFINPITYFLLTIIFFILGLSTLDIINLHISFFTPHYDYKKGLISLFILGIISGLALVPCNFPVLGAILTLISLKKNILYGGLALFLFSLGYGTVLIFLGTFSSFIGKLPKQNIWFTVIRKIQGGVILIMGIYFLVKFIGEIFR